MHVDLHADLQAVLDDEEQKHLLLSRIMGKLARRGQLRSVDERLALVHELAFDDTGTHAIGSRDFGRGYAHAMRLIREALGEPD